MIRIDRNRLDKHGDPIRPNQEWFEKAEEATELAIRENGAHEFQQSIYAHIQVRTALEELFHYKCAYCESNILDVRWDVEHFRPKGKVTECPTHPGYYWLTYTWENLYPSCIYCNRNLKDKPIREDMTTGSAKGKGNHFPLEPGSPRVMSHLDDIQLERPLLLDPCTDNPEEHLSFDHTGQIINANNSQKGFVSIEVLHLKRKKLSKARKSRIKAIIMFLERINKHKAEDNMTAVQSLNELLEELFLADNCPYAAVARAVVNNPDAFGL